MADIKPVICGKPRIYVPDRECTDCEQLERRVTRLEECCDDVYTKEEVNELIAGVSHSGGFKLVDALPASGENGYIYLVPNTPPETGYDQWIWTDSGWVDIGTEQLTLDKASILTALGYEEIDIKMKDVNSNESTWTILAEI